MPTDTSVGINFLAVIVSAIVYMILGALWYSPPLFGKRWMRAIGKTEEQVKADSKPMNYVVAFIMSFLAAYGIARILLWKGGDTIRDGVMVAFVAGICFVLSTFISNDRFEGRSGGLTLVNTIYHVGGFIVMGIILGVWH